MRHALSTAPGPWPARRLRPQQRQQGTSLIVTLLMLVAVMLLGVSAAQIALQGEKASRNDRDRQIAFQAAEAALIDAEQDIEGSLVSADSRSSLFSKDSALGFPLETEALCPTGHETIKLGLCRRAPDGTPPAWRSVDFEDEGKTTQSVPYGKFTGQVFPTGLGSLPIVPPRYIIELMQYKRRGQAADEISYFYRLTAVGFGLRKSTQVALQSYYRKER